jgi:hypothetical protein
VTKVELRRKRDISLASKLYKPRAVIQYLTIPNPPRVYNKKATKIGWGWVRYFKVGK